MVANLNVVDTIEENVNRTVDNLGKIEQALVRLGTLISIVENKVDILNKTKKK